MQTILQINITESAPIFSESITVSSIYAESETGLRDIYVGHLEELHYVSTTPIRPTTQSIFTEIKYIKQQVINQKQSHEIQNLIKPLQKKLQRRTI